MRDEQTAWRDDSSEVSDEGYKSQGNTGPRTLPRNRKPTPKKSMELDPTDMLGESFVLFWLNVCFVVLGFTGISGVISLLFVVGI